MRYARDIGTFIVNRFNWHIVITTIWGSIDREIRFVLKAPEDHKNLADFIKRVEQTKYFIASFIRDLASGRIPYTSYGYESYPSCPAYTERFCNLQPFRRCDNKTYDVRFLSCIYKKDIDSKGKSIDRISQSKPWEAGRDVNKDVCVYTMYSDDEDSYVFQPFLSARF